MDYLIPRDIKDQINIIKIKPGQLGNGFTPKLHLDQLAKQGQTLFIDSDCLIFGNLEKVFDKFKGNSVSVIGSFISEGEWYGDVKKICANYKIPHYPKFNGGVYYLEKGAIASKVYETARNLEKLYDEIGFERFRNHTADEILMALALQLNGQKPIADEGTILGDLQASPGKLDIDVINGGVILRNPPYPHPKHQIWYQHKESNPLIVHFLGHHTKSLHYKFETYRLERAFRGKNKITTNLKGLLKIKWPMQIEIFIKDFFRPFFRFLIGTRRVRTSERL